MHLRRPHSLRTVTTLALCCALGSALSVASAQTFEPKADPVFQKMLSLNKGLRSYKAHVTVETHIMVASFTLRGTIYDRAGRTRIVFDNVPAIARSSVENQPTVGPPSTWAEEYAITVAARDDDTTTYHLVPNDSGSVRSVDATVRNATGLVQRFVWQNANGMTISSNQTYETIEGYQVVKYSDTDTHGRGVPTNSHAIFSDYEINAALPDSIFAQQ